MKSGQRLKESGMTGGSRAARTGTSRMGRRLALFLAAVMLASLVAGCGAASNDGSTAGGMAESVAPSSAFSNMAVRMTSTADRSGSGEAGVASQLAVAGGSAADVPAAISRKIIYSAEVTMEVADFDRTRDELDRLVAEAGGYMLHFSDSRSVSRINGHFTMKVPSDGFRSFLDQLETMKKGNEFRKNVRGEDVTEEYVDLDARLGAKEAVEARLLDLMKQANEAHDLLAFSNELARVQEEIESLKGRMRYINENVAYSTVELHMYQVIEGGVRRPGDDGLQSRLGRALVGSTEGVIRFLGDFLVFLVGALPVLILLAIMAVPVLFLVRQLRKKRKSDRTWGPPSAPITPQTPPSGQKPPEEAANNEGAAGDGGENGRS